jgi:hypothetical protein
MHRTIGILCALAVAGCPSRLYVPTHASPSQLSFAYGSARASSYKILYFTHPHETAVLAAAPRPQED